jgi:hypothetical protein
MPLPQIFRPLPRTVTRPLAIFALLAWIVTMGVIVNRSYLQASPLNLATDLARYGSAAKWRGVYYRGEKIGFTVSQVQAVDDGFELQEDGRLQFSLLGATTPAILRTTARVDRTFQLLSFDFSLDPGTGPMAIKGRLDGLRLSLEMSSASGTRTETRELKEAPALMLSVGRRLATEGLTAGTKRQWAVFDPATLTNAPVTIAIGDREVVRGSARLPIPAFKVQMTFAGLTSTAWVTDTGEIVREESPMGLLTVLETQEQATTLGVSDRMRVDMLQASAIVPQMNRHTIVEPRDVSRLRLRLSGADLSSLDLDGEWQRVDGSEIELIDPRGLTAGPAPADLDRYLLPEPFIESDAPEIRAAAELMVQGITGTRARAERLTREINSYVEKRPTVSLPSALEVLRTRVGDCNEHTVLFIAMARSLGIPARTNVGVAFVHGAFYYHAWPEVWIDEGKGRGLWLPVDPTFNQFPADATHLRLARGGLDKQTAIMPLIGQARINVTDVQTVPNTTPILVGGQAAEVPPAFAIPMPRRQECGCWASPCAGGSRP